MQALTFLNSLVLIWLASPMVAQRAIEDSSKSINGAVRVMQDRHLKRPKLDDDICMRWFETYLNSLDPSRHYFLDRDITEFRKFISRLPDFAESGNCDFYRLVTKRFKERVAAATEVADEILATGFDFTVDQNFEFKREIWPASIEERNEHWRLMLKYQLMVEMSGGTPIDTAIAFLKQRYHSINRQAEKMTDERAAGIYLDSYCRSIDPHSGYFTETEYTSFFGGKLREYSIGLKFKYINGRAMIIGIQSDFQNEESAADLLGCELLAIRSNSDDLHNLREIHSHDIYELIKFGLGRASAVTLELYDETRLNRFAVRWPRK